MLRLVKCAHLHAPKNDNELPLVFSGIREADLNVEVKGFVQVRVLSGTADLRSIVSMNVQGNIAGQLYLNLYPRKTDCYYGFSCVWLQFCCVVRFVHKAVIAILPIYVNTLLCWHSRKIAGVFPSVVQNLRKIAV